MDEMQLALLQQSMQTTTPNFGIGFQPNSEGGSIMNVLINMGISYNNQHFLSFTRQATFVVTDLQNPFFNPIPYFFSDIYSAKREEFLFTGIRNLRKNVKFLQLTNELANKHITDKEFESEIEAHPEKYLIDIKPMTDPEDVIILHEIVNKIADDFTVDEAADIFSFDSESVKQNINQLNK